MKQLQRAHLATQIALALGAWSAYPISAALAQTAPSAKAADSGEIQSVTVTANRRAEDQQKVSVSVTAVTDTLTFCWSSARRLAVTVTLWISPLSAALAEGAVWARAALMGYADQAPSASAICVAR